MTNEQQEAIDRQVSQPKKISTADKIKFAGLIFFILLLVAVGVAIFPYFKELTTEEGRLALIDSIQRAGVLGIGICLGLQFVQVVVAFIPGEVTQLAIGAIYGPVWGTLITALGALISSIFVFFVVRKLGRPFVSAMISDKQIEKMGFLKETRRLDTVVFILFLIPGLPKDVFTYIVPLTEMRPIHFFVLSTLARIPGIIASAVIGNAAIQGDFMLVIIVAAIVGGIGILGIVFNNKIMTTVDRITNTIGHKKQ
jgi:uncharacterized membrane protein YdjX (TVP38/TMEM64 family)